MKKHWLWLVPCLALIACGKQDTAPAQSEQSPTAETTATPSAPAPGPAAQADAPTSEAPVTAPAEAISETDEPADVAAATSSVHPSLKLGTPPPGPATSAQFREGTHYQKIVPAQPTTAAPGNVEVLEVFWYGCAHCFSLDPAIEAWRGKGKAPYVEFVRVPAMWNETTRMHARVFFTAELLGKLDSVHTLIFREVHVNGNPLNTIDKISAFFQKHGVSNEEFTKAFSSFAVENKLQRADFLNRRYRIQSVPTFVVNGKFKTAVSDAGGEEQLFALIGELATHEHGG